MKARTGLSAAVLLVSTLGPSGCSATRTDCLVRHSPVFDLSVVGSSGHEQSVRFCDREQCSPVPEAGAVPAYLTDRSNEHGAFLRHRARGEWSIEPRGVGDAAPDEASVGLYQGGALVATRSIRISWPDVDPCAATLPPPPHVTVRAG